MKLLKLLNNKNFFLISVLFLSFFTQLTFAEDSVDIWNIKNINQKKEVNIQDNTTEENLNSIYKTNSQKEITSIISEEKDITAKEINIIGMYDPSDNDLSINMWSYSDGQKIIGLISKIKKINLSKDANEILEILLLTNTHYPQKNITKDEFLNLKSDWLIEHNDLELIKNYLLINKNLKNKSELMKFYIDNYLSKGDIVKSCGIFKDHNDNFEDNYLSKFKIYCLLNEKKNEEAQLQLDLIIEGGFKDKFFENKFFNLIGYEKEETSIISEESLLNFHLSYLTSSNFKFNPKSTTSKLIWRYLSSFNLLASIESVDLEDKDEILKIEQATHDKNYEESDLFDLYTRFMFNINQLLTVEQSYKVIPNHQARALLYQGILLSKTPEEKINLIKILKESFIKENISKAFDEELLKHLKSIDKNDVTSNHSSFYNFYLEIDQIQKNKIKFNNKILHQSKILNHFIEKNYSSKNAQKDFDAFLKKAKKNKKYFFSTKDIIFIEALVSDGIKIPKKYNKMFELNQSLVPDDIRFLIHNNETGLVLLRLIEIIGQDMIVDIDVETLHFIVNVLNQLNIDKLRNKILIKVLPLKV
jgi:hypothetical protein